MKDDLTPLLNSIPLYFPDRRRWGAWFTIYILSLVLIMPLMTSPYVALALLLSIWVRFHSPLLTKTYAEDRLKFGRICTALEGGALILVFLSSAVFHRGLLVATMASSALIAASFVINWSAERDIDKSQPRLGTECAVLSTVLMSILALSSTNAREEIAGVWTLGIFLIAVIRLSRLESSMTVEYGKEWYVSPAVSICLTPREGPLWSRLTSTLLSGAGIIGVAVTICLLAIGVL